MNENKNLEFVEIQVHGTKDTPYYEIHYIENGEHHIGYSSYNIKYVSDWLKEFFIKPVVHGQWVMSTDKTYMPQCTNCGAHPFKGYIPSVEEVSRTYKFCPNCGAKMDESSEETAFDDHEISGLLDDSKPARPGNFPIRAAIAKRCKDV